MTTSGSNALERFAHTLNGAGIDYAIIGGHAVNAWLEPRFTADIDFMRWTSSEGEVVEIQFAKTELQRDRRSP